MFKCAVDMGKMSVIPQWGTKKKKNLTNKLQMVDYKVGSAVKLS